MALSDPRVSEVITIDDFSPGIHSDYHYSPTPTPAATAEGHIRVPGAATIEDTARCCSDLTGALVPLPKLVAGQTSEPLPTGDNADSQYWGDAESFLLDGMVRGDMGIFSENNAENADRAGVYVMYGQAWYETGSTATYTWTIIAQLHRLYEDSSPFHDLMWGRFDTSLNDLTRLQIGSGNFIPFKNRLYVDDADAPARINNIDSVMWVAYGSPGYELAQGAAEKSGSIPTDERALTDFDTTTGTTYPGMWGRIIGIHPKPFQHSTGFESGFLDETYSEIEGEVFRGVCWLVAHQGRFVGLARLFTPAGQIFSQHARVSESIWFSPIQDFYGALGFGCFEKLSFAEEKPDRTGAVASITADEIIFIKDRGGAVMVRGDLENPTIVQLPYVESTHGARSIPIATPLGLVYGTRNGVSLWEGGDTTRLLSPQIEGWFWNHTDAVDYLGPRGRFGWWHPWVCVPNNFLYDTRTNSWWRLDTPTNTGEALNCYDVVNESNRLYAFPFKLTATQNTMWYTATPDSLCRTYTWKSQPLVQSRSRVMTFREVEIIVSPGSTTAATITVTLSGYTKDGVAVTPVVTTFTTTGNKNTQILHKDIVANFQATHVQIQIQADSGSDSQPAPKIHSISLSTGERARVAKG